MYIYSFLKTTTIMKQTAIQISMINNNINTSKNNNGEPQMTSLEIAQLTGKQHKHVMEAIRKMEPAWATIAGSNFRLGSYEDANGQLRPCYLLSKVETLYIATKFNDEARAILVIRWEQLEKERRLKAPVKEIRLLASDEEVLDEAEDIIGAELEKLNQYSDECYTSTEIAKPFGMLGSDLNSFLKDQGIISKSNGQWHLTRNYLHRGLTETRSFCYYNRKGRRVMDARLVWTEKGRQFILDILRG